MAKVLRSFLRELTIPALAVLAGAVVGTFFILISGEDPLEAYYWFGNYVAGSPEKFGETLVSSIPLIFTGLAIALAFRCGLFNIGVEGQYMLGQVSAAYAGYALVGLPGFIHLPVAILFGIGAGALWATVPALLKAYRGVHEVINSIMMNYIAFYLTHWLVMNPMRDPGGASGTPQVKATATLMQGLIEGSRLHAGLWIALFAAFFVWLFLWRTAAGYEIRAVGFAPGAAEYAGVKVKKNILLAMALSGGLAGLAAAVQTLAIARRFYEPLGFVGFGLDGIAVALVGRTHPVGVVLSALLFGSLERGGIGMQAGADVPKAITWIVQGTVIFFVAAEGVWRFLKNRRAKAEVKSA